MANASGESFFTEAKLDDFVPISDSSSEPENCKPLDFSIFVLSLWWRDDDNDVFSLGTDKALILVRHPILEKIANTNNEDKKIIIMIVTLSSLLLFNINFLFLSCFTIFQIKCILSIIKAIDELYYITIYKTRI